MRKVGKSIYYHGETLFSFCSHIKDRLNRLGVLFALEFKNMLEEKTNKEESIRYLSSILSSVSSMWISTYERTYTDEELLDYFFNAMDCKDKEYIRFYKEFLYSNGEYIEPYKIHTKLYYKRRSVCWFRDTIDKLLILNLDQLLSKGTLLKDLNDLSIYTINDFLLKDVKAILGIYKKYPFFKNYLRDFINDYIVNNLETFKDIVVDFNKELFEEKDANLLSLIRFDYFKDRLLLSEEDIFELSKETIESLYINKEIISCEYMKTDHYKEHKHNELGCYFSLRTICSINYSVEVSDIDELINISKEDFIELSKSDLRTIHEIYDYIMSFVLLDKDYQEQLNELYYKILDGHRVKNSTRDDIIVIKCENKHQIKSLDCFCKLVGIIINNKFSRKLEHKLIDIFMIGDYCLAASSDYWSPLGINKKRELGGIDYPNLKNELSDELLGLIEKIEENT